jgi:hypothetical protein
MKFRQKDIFVKGAESPQVRTIEYANGTAKVKLEFATESERAGVRTVTWHHVDFLLNYDEIACVMRSLAACVNSLDQTFNERIEGARQSVRRQLG